MSEIGKIMEEIILSPLQKDLIKFLEKNGPSTRADIVRGLEKPRTTIYDNLEGLMLNRIVKKYSRPTNSRGRPLVFFRVIEEYERPVKEEVPIIEEKSRKWTPYRIVERKEEEIEA